MRFVSPFESPMDNSEPQSMSDRDFDGTSTQQVLTLLRKDSNHTFMFIVDQETLARDDRPVLVIDLFVEPGRTFRVIPSAMWSVENSLSLANMDFAEFADSADEDGIFRGFPEA